MSVDYKMIDAAEMASPIFNISGDDYQKSLANYDSLLKDSEEFLGYSD